jgi:hypothetical protein
MELFTLPADNYYMLKEYQVSNQVFVTEMEVGYYLKVEIQAHRFVVKLSESVGE